jgi:hypothetical protein
MPAGASLYFTSMATKARRPCRVVQRSRRSKALWSEVKRGWPRHAVEGITKSEALEGAAYGVRDCVARTRSWLGADVFGMVFEWHDRAVPRR